MRRLQGDFWLSLGVGFSYVFSFLFLFDERGRGGK